MNRAIKTVLIVLAVLAAAAVAVALVYRYKILDGIRDGGSGMTNPNLEETLIQPAAGAELVFCTLTGSGEMAEDNYNYTLEQDGEATRLYADYTAADGTRVTIDGQEVAATALTELNTLALSMELTETHYREEPDKPFLLDGGKKQYTLRWDDGTEATPDEGFDEIKNYFETNVLTQTGTKGG